MLPTWVRPAWFDRAACLGIGPDWFYPTTREPATPAMGICVDCPVRAECLAHSLDTGEDYGTWGGTSERSRRRMLRVRRTAA